MPPEANDDRQPRTGPELWQGLEEYMDSAAFHKAMEDEFPENAAEWVDPVSRRNFLQLMGASLALAGAGCYSNPSPRPAPQRKIVPYIEQPDEIVPGLPLYFSSVFPLAGYSTGVVVRSNEGRPTKVEGNPLHPSSLGGTSVFAQASLLEMYDPDRSQLIRKNSQEIGYDSVMADLAKKFYDDDGKPRTGLRLRVLTETITSPTLGEELEGLLKLFPNAKWAQYDTHGGDNIREGVRRAYGENRSVFCDFTKADVVLSLDADFLCSGPASVRYSKDFASRRRVRKSEADGIKPEQMSRLYAVECTPTVSGASADHRLPVLSSQVESFARALAAELKVPGTPAPGSLTETAKLWLAPLVKDLLAHKGHVAVIVGDHLPASVHALAFAINSFLDSVGNDKPVQIVEAFEAPISPEARAKVIDLKTLVGEMQKKEVDLLFILGTNVAYTAPADVPVVAALKNVPTKVHFGLYFDETAFLCDYHIPEAHYLESWGDGRGHNGIAAIQQPIIAPLYKGKSTIEFFADLLRLPVRDGFGLVKGFWQKWFETAKKDGEFDNFWHTTLREGLVRGTEAKAVAASLAGGWAEKSGPLSPPPATGEYELNYRFDPTLYDGRFANLGWLQELPKPITKLTWDNAVFMSPKTAEALNIEKDFRWTAGERGRVEVSIVELDIKGRKVRAPVWIHPGHPDAAISVYLGSGRERAGRVGNAASEKNAEGKLTRGFNAYVLRTSDKLWFESGAKVTRTSDTYFLACVQGNYSMSEKDPTSGKELDRKPVRHGSLAEYQRNPSFGKFPPTAVPETELINENVPGSTHKHESKEGEKQDDGHGRLHPLTMYWPNEVLAPGLPPERTRKWAMSIDLTTCTGCNACDIACVAENNIPVVGKHEVTRGHEMHWIRVDRYYTGDPKSAEDIETFVQPVPCQQCEKAPCEVVCPVGATVHSTDGLNDMVYNRCVGTRYCSNNCPYKVRRFNFLTFQDWTTESIKLGRNPEVSVRSRGVMEKCTYCVQRIRSAEITAERQGRSIRDGEVVTACQAACPSGAIMFGDMADTSSAIHRWKLEPATYGLLAELNTMPRTTYLSCVRNPNPELAEALSKAKSGTIAAH